VVRLRLERQKRNWTQQDLAVKVGMHSSEICRIERGYMKPYPRHAERLESLFGIPMCSLLSNIDAVTDQSAGTEDNDEG
jgi:ribosome-binding protein aMBF1 (putative translation factor)